MNSIKTNTNLSKTIGHVSKFFDIISEQLLFLFHELKIKVLFVWGVLILGHLTILRADYHWSDDWGRVTWGSGDDTGTRPLTSILYGFENQSMSSFFDHGVTKFSDLGLYTQILALLILSIVTVLLIQMIIGKTSYLVLFCAASVGLSPWMLFCTTYRFDSIAMAFSLFMTILPIIIMHFSQNIDSLKRKLVIYFTVSLVCLLMAYVTYQTYVGVYIVITLIYGFLLWIKNSQKTKYIGLFIATGALAFVVSTIIYKIYFSMHAGIYAKMNGDSFGINELIPGMLHNSSLLFKALRSDIVSWQKLLLFIILIAAVVNIIRISKKNKIVSAVIFLVGVPILIIFVQITGLIAKNPQIRPHQMAGYGVLIATITAIAFIDFNKIKHKVAKLFIVAPVFFSLSLLAQSTAVGNALKADVDYEKVYAAVLLEELNNPAIPQDESFSVTFKGNLGTNPVKSLAQNNWPIVNRFYKNNLGVEPLNFDFYLPRNMHHGRETTVGVDEFEDLPILVDDRFAQIRQKGSELIVQFKEAKVSN
jgi:hypothetical protein